MHAHRVEAVVIGGSAGGIDALATILPNEDGAAKHARIRSAGGVAIVQSPETSLAPATPEAALRGTAVDEVLAFDATGPYVARAVVAAAAEGGA